MYVPVLKPYRIRASFRQMELHYKQPHHLISQATIHRNQDLVPPVTFVHSDQAILDRAPRVNTSRASVRVAVYLAISIATAHSVE